MKTTFTRNIPRICAFVLLAQGVHQAGATLVTPDQILYQGSGGGTTVDPALLSGTIDVSISGNTLTILMRNTSLDGAFAGGGAPASMLLTGFGFQLPTGVQINGGTVEVNAGSTAVNFSGTDISNQYEYGNVALNQYLMSGVLSVDTVLSSRTLGGPNAIRFAGPPPVNIDGPDYGAISALETEFGNSTQGVNDTVKFTLNLSGPATYEQIEAGNVVLSFGSPNQIVVPEPGTYFAAALLAIPAIVGIGRLRRGRSQ